MNAGKDRRRTATRTWLTLSTCLVVGLLGVIYAYGMRVIGS